VTERGNTRSHSVETSLWNRLQVYRKNMEGTNEFIYALLGKRLHNERRVIGLSMSCVGNAF
jgi:hypothetical protein